jgi:hypothetical protein
MKQNLASHLVAFGFAAAALATSLLAGYHTLAAEPVLSVGGPGIQQAYEQLLSTKSFAFGGVGFAGTTSAGQKAFDVIAARTNALELFRAVLSKGNPEGKMYALCGIHRLAPEKFNNLAKPVVAANSKVSTMSGCLVMEDRAANVVARIAKGFYDLQIGAIPIEIR